VRRTSSQQLPVAAERFGVVLSTNFDRNNSLVKVPSPGQLLSEILQLGLGNLPKGVAEGRSLIHVGHFKKEIRFHSHYSSLADTTPTINGSLVHHEGGDRFQ
jgi:hypothetical protein